MDDDIIRMAREAQQERLSLDGRSPSTALSGHWFSMEVADLARFAALVAAAERERIKAEPVEPVAYRHLHEDGWEYHDAPTGEDCAECQALYTAPPHRKPLTGERLKQIELGLRIYYDNGKYDLSLHDFARAVERAHGIKE